MDLGFYHLSFKSMFSDCFPAGKKVQWLAGYKVLSSYMPFTCDENWWEGCMKATTQGRAFEKSLTCKAALWSHSAGSSRAGHLKCLHWRWEPNTNPASPPRPHTINRVLSMQHNIGSWPVLSEYLCETTGGTCVSQSVSQGGRQAAAHSSLLF